MPVKEIKQVIYKSSDGTIFINSLDAKIYEAETNFTNRIRSIIEDSGLPYRHEEVIFEFMKECVSSLLEVFITYSTEMPPPEVVIKRHTERNGE